MKPIQIGKIAFTNILPLYHHFHYSDLPVELIPQVPSQLNKSMAAGSIDMGPISSFAYADDYPKYVIMPDLAWKPTGFRPRPRSYWLVRKIYIYHIGGVIRLPEVYGSCCVGFSLQCAARCKPQ